MKRPPFYFVNTHLVENLWKNPQFSVEKPAEKSN